MLLEGLEVIFIVITFGDSQGDLGAATLAAVAAVLVVTVIGIAVRAPLARVPENTMKFAVGIMLTAFGTFWGAEGAGVRWPGNDIALLVLVPVIGLVSLGYALALRQSTPAADPLSAAAAVPPAAPPPAAAPTAVPPGEAVR